MRGALGVAVLAVATILFGCGKSATAQAAYGYTSLNYDAPSNTLTGFSETDMDAYAATFYNANVTLTLTDPNGVNLGQVSQSDSGYAPVSVTLTANPTNGGYYVAAGFHFITAKMFGYPGNCAFSYGQCWLDFYAMSSFESFDISAPWDYEFLSPGGPPTYSSNDFYLLGETYDTATQYVSLPCNDERDQEIQEYATNHVALKPNCASFTNSLPWNFPPYDFNTLNSGDYQWAILKDSLASGMTSIELYFGGVANTSVNSGYRNPFKQARLDASLGVAYTVNSRHQFGDAVDWGTQSNQAVWNSYADAGHQANACVEPEKYSKVGHVHTDWRWADGWYIAGGGTCPRGW